MINNYELTIRVFGFVIIRIIKKGPIKIVWIGRFTPETENRIDIYQFYILGIEN